MIVTVNISNRHLHLSQTDLEILFGKYAKLTELKKLMQPGQFSCNETVTIVGPKNKIENVRIIGPVRKQTQIEISRTDSFYLGIKPEPPVRESGDLKGSSPITVIGPQGKIDLKEGCIIALRHIHFDLKSAEKYNIKDKQIVSVRAGKGTNRELIFNNVICRVREDMAFECHIDTDEANAGLIKNGDKVEIII